MKFALGLLARTENPAAGEIHDQHDGKLALLDEFLNERVVHPRGHVQVDRADGGVELAVGDSGPLLAEEQRNRIFEPFQAPAETGSGLGLALVQVYVEDAGGRATWDDGAAAGRCRLWFPLAPSAPKGGHL